MPLTVIKGPPNSGRTDILERRYLESLGQRPVLVVPGVDDIFHWEKRLTRGSGALVGGQVVHFQDLFVEILKTAGASRRPSASELKRLSLVRRAVEETSNEIKDLLPDQPGLVRAVLDLIDGFQNELVDPLTLESRATENALGGIVQYARIYQHYLDALADEGLTDGAGEGRAAINLLGETWTRRPVMFAGFDEMTGQQREVIRRLAFGCEVDVTVAVTFEPNNPAMNLTATLVSELEHLGPDEKTTRLETGRRDDLPHAPLLLRLQRDFLREDCRATIDPEDDPDALTVLRSAGHRAEAEAIGGEIARLLAGSGSRGPVPPDEIAVAIEAPARNGAVIRDVLADLDIPVSLEGETPAHATTTGQAVLNLLAASRPEGTARDLIAYLRAPGGPDADEVDRLELHCRVRDLSSARAIAGLVGERAVADLRAIQEREDAATVVAAVARRVAGSILRQDPAPVPSNATVIEIRTAEALAKTCEEIREIEADRDHVAAITEAIQSGLVKVWAVSDQGTVRIASPYSLRGKRFRCLFHAGLQEAPIVDTDRISPFLSAGDLGVLEMNPRRDPEDQQRYLFYSCLTVPTDSLFLSCRISDETGSPEHPSPLIESVESLLVTDPEGLPRVRRGGRLGSDSVFQPDRAPTAAELARSLRGNRIAETAVPGVSAEVSTGIDASQNAAEQAARANAGFADLGPDVTRHWDAVPELGATELEAYSCCPYQWFVERQLRPQRFGPEPDYFASGNLVHTVLERLYSGDPGKMPENGNIPDGWLEKLPELVDEAARAPGAGLGSDSITHAAARKMAELQVRLYLKRQAGTVPYFRPELFEVAFGTGRAELDAVEMGAWKLKGKIDRVDLGPETGSGDQARRQALVIDYKTGSVTTDYSPWNVEKKRKLQTQLYMLALEKLGERLGLGQLRPVAGMYVPVRLDDLPARGAVACEEKKLSSAGSEVTIDLLSRGMADGETVGSIDEYIELGKELADEAFSGIAAGRLAHDPATCARHFDSPVVRVRPAEEEEENRP